jgi:hypothetical protein
VLLKPSPEIDGMEPTAFGFWNPTRLRASNRLGRSTPSPARPATSVSEPCLLDLQRPSGNLLGRGGQPRRECRPICPSFGQRGSLEMGAGWAGREESYVQSAEPRCRGRGALCAIGRPEVPAASRSRWPPRSAAKPCRMMSAGGVAGYWPTFLGRARELRGAGVPSRLDHLEMRCRM